MCELLAIASRFPTTVRLSLDELARHGGDTGPHRDGWGIALLDERDAMLLRDPEAASSSPWVRFFEEHQPRATIAIAHVRKATQGERRLRNTQPFTRELGGQMHVFAHNGMLPGIEAAARFGAKRFRPVGETDSEHAFCALLDRLAPSFDVGPPSERERVEIVVEFARDLRSAGLANFIYSDGDLVIAHGDRRTQPDKQVRGPGLHVLCRTCSMASDAPSLVGVSISRDERQEVALVASVPLSDERWEPLAEGEVVVMRGGRVIQRIV